MLNLTDVHSYYGTSHILHGIDLRIEKGDVFALMGRNGVGKTTLLRTIMGLTDHATGAIELDDEEITKYPTYRRAQAGIAYVPQGRDIIPGFTVEDTILMGCYARRDGGRAIPDEIWSLFPVLREHLRRLGSNLSGGQQQQLAIARAVTSDPVMVLLDEPTEGIQPNVVEQIERAIARLNRELGLTVILVEQDIAFVRSVATKFAILEKGRVVAGGGIGELSDEVCHRHLSV